MANHKYPISTRVRGKDDAPRAWVRGLEGTVKAHGPSSGEYTLSLDDCEETWVMVSWIELAQPVGS